MVWLGLILGVVVGGLFGGVQGAIVLGFLGWLAALILKSHQRGPSQPVKTMHSAGTYPAGTAPKPKETLEDRVARLEKIVAELQVGRVSSVEVEGPVTEPLPHVPEAAPEPAPLAEPVTLAEAVTPAEAGAQASRPKRHLPPKEPPKPNPLWAWITGGNTIARVGLLILFIGLAFLVKYAADHALFPPEFRVALVAGAGIALLGFGWKLRESRPGYALGLQGAGVAVLYLTVFAALRLWHLVPAPAAFVLLAGIAAFSAIIAVRQDSMALAAIGASGGFLAPILASTGGGSHVMLFSYYLLLNLGIAGVALYKAWRGLNLVGFLFTFFIGLTWGYKFYQPGHFDSVEPFLAAFFLLYVAIAILFARKQEPSLKHFVDGTIVFGTPLAAFGLQAAMVQDIEMALAYTALVMSALYLGLAWYLRRSGEEGPTLLSRAFVALGIVFASAAIPLALDARWTAAAWALEGAAIIWYGLKQQRVLARLFGELLQLLAGAAFLNSLNAPIDPRALFAANPPFMGAALLAIAGFWTNRQLSKAKDEITGFERGLTPFIFAWATFWWFIGVNSEIHLHLEPKYTLNAHVLMFSLTAAVMAWLGTRWDWTEAKVGATLLLPILILFAIVSAAGHSHPFAYAGWFTWPVAIAVHVWILRGREEENTWTGFLRVGGLLLIAGLGARELHWVAVNYTAPHTAWSVASVVVVPAILLLWTARKEEYRVGNLVLSLLFVAWVLYANITHNGNNDPLPYFPLLNALDLAHVLGAIAVLTAGVVVGQQARIVAGALVFVWLNGVLLRTLHHWADVPYTLGGVLGSVVAQSALSIFWSVLSLSLMVYATRTAKRAVWMLGATLMGVVVVKMFLVDLSHVSGIARIISFIAVGLLMLVVGYFSPLPPHKPEEES